jgi:crotonobetainyl-CoA:carnitine CoA-transferase CaiB-like acyl-CoA transferase
MHFPWAGVASIPQLLASPQLEARGFWTEVEHPVTGEKFKFPAPVLNRCFASHTRPTQRGAASDTRQAPRWKEREYLHRELQP